MDLKHLESFIYVADLHSFSKAADKLFVSQPTITAHIQNLEKELDCALLNRLGHTVTLTNAGEIFYRYAKDVVYTLGSAKLEISVSNSNIEGNVSILSSSVPKLFYLPDKISKFADTHPGITFNISGLDSMNVVNNVKNGKCDFGIVGFKFPDPTLLYTNIFFDEICYVIKKDKFPGYSNFDSIDYDDIKDIPLMLREPGSGTFKTFANAVTKSYPDIIKNNYSVFDSNELIINLVKKGYGGSFISSWFTDNKNDILKLRLKGTPIKRSFYLVRHKNKKLSPGAEAFYDFLV